MARELSSAVAAAVSAQVVRPALLYEGEFPAGTLRMWTGMGTISWDGQTWVGGGQMLSFSAIGESSDTRALGMEISLSGAVTSLISVAIGQAQQGLPGRVYLGLFEPTEYAASGSDFSSSSWTREGMLAFGSGSVVNDATAPDGTLTMDKFVEDTSGSYHRFAQGYGSLPLNDRYKWEIYVKRNAAGSARDCALQITAGDNNYIFQQFNLGTGALGTSSPSGNGQQLDAGIEDVGGGIYRIWLTGIANTGSAASGVVGYFYQTLTNGNNQYTGDGASGLTVWGASFKPSPDSYSIMADPFKVFEGRLDTTEIDDEGETSRIALKYESRLIDLDRRRERRYTSEDQHLDFPADRGFEYVPAIQDMPIFWGRFSPEQQAVLTNTLKTIFR